MSAIPKHRLFRGIETDTKKDAGLRCALTCTLSLVPGTQGWYLGWRDVTYQLVRTSL